MSNRASSKQHGHANTDCLRPKSKLRKKVNKAQARTLREERQAKLQSAYKKAVTGLNSEF